VYREAIDKGSRGQGFKGSSGPAAPGVLHSDPRTLGPSNPSLSWRFRVTFSGSLPPKYYLSPDVRRTDPGWGSEAFSRPIEKLEFFLPTGHVVVMSGMEKYCFFIEASKSLSGGNERLEAVWLAGLIPQGSRGQGFKGPSDGSPAKPGHSNPRTLEPSNPSWQQKPYGAEWGGTPIAGWKTGAPGGALKSEIVKGA